jgi:hypothetical protein
MGKRAELRVSLCRCVLAEFGYSPRQCERLLVEGTPEDMLQKTSDVILDSHFGLSMDWRGELEEEFLEPLAEIAEHLGVKFEYDTDEDDADQADVTITVGGKSRTTRVCYRPNKDSLDDVAKAIQKASGDRLIFRALHIYRDSDTYCYAVLSPARWSSVKVAAGSAFGSIFAELK